MLDPPLKGLITVDLSTKLGRNPMNIHGVTRAVVGGSAGPAMAGLVLGLLILYKCLPFI